MVYIKPAVAGAVALSLVSSVAALPTSNHASRNVENGIANKRDGPMVVQAKSLQAAKRAYAGNASVKQSPLMKATKLFRSKRDIVKPRGEDVHIHEHIHEHDDDHHHHHHHDAGYDPHHSEHWNYHHGHIADDDHHHHHARGSGIINVNALNINGPVGNKSFKEIHKSKKVEKECHGNQFSCEDHSSKNNKRYMADTDGDDADDADEETEEQAKPRLIRRRKNKHQNGNKHYNGNNGGGKKYNHINNGYSKQGGGKHGPGLSAKGMHAQAGAKVSADQLNSGKGALEARHRHHHHHDDDEDDHYWHDDDHEHVHIHSHEHKRDLKTRHEDVHMHEHIHEDYDNEHHHHHHHHHDHDKRRHNDHDEDEWLDHMTYDRDYDHGHAHIHVHEHDGHHHHHRRDVRPAGIPGFVEVASTLFNSNLAKTVAGLVFSKGTDPNAEGFLLGTSDNQSTQFYLTPMMSGSNAGSTNSSSESASPEGDAQTYQLRIPVLDAKSLDSKDYCATFDIQPPSPMSMMPCGTKDGYSQAFRYNPSSGELTPVYPATSEQPKPMNAAVKFIAEPQEEEPMEPMQMAASFPVNNMGGTTSATDASATAATNMPSSTASAVEAGLSAEASGSSNDSQPQPSAAPAASSSSAASQDSATPSDAPKVSLFFIPASSFYSVAEPSSASAVSSPSPTSSSEPTAAEGPLFSAAPAQAKIAQNEDWDSTLNDASADQPANGGSSNVVTTTVVVTSTVDGSGPAPTGASQDWSDSVSSSSTTSDTPAATDAQPAQ